MNEPVQGSAPSVKGVEGTRDAPDRAVSNRDRQTDDVAPTDTPPAHRPAAVLSLKQAMRRARFDDAERSSSVADLRLARLGRLDVLQDALKPLIAQIPAEIDCFDVGIMPGANPRLFIDMIGFVEMGRDPRVYRFLQDTRHGRVTLAESETVEAIVEAATHYVARRLLERDKALASDGAEDPSSRHAFRDGDPRRSQDRVPGSSERPAAEAAPAPPAARHAPAGRSPLGLLAVVFAFFIDVLGSIAFFSLLAFAGWVIWSNVKH